MLLDLGSGPRPRYGHEGVDRIAHPAVKWVCNFDKFPWVFYPAHLYKDDGTRIGGEYLPMDFEGTFYGGRSHPHGEQPYVPDNFVEGVNANQLVEHIVDLVGFMNELWRVCKDGAEATIQHPYQFSVRAWQDPTHVRGLNELSWFYYDKSWRGERPEFGDTDFELVECDAIPEENWKELAKENPEEFERAARNQINVIADLRVILRCRK